MFVEVKNIDIEVEPQEILFQALSEGDLSIDDAVRICEEEAGTYEVLECIEDEDIQIYCNKNGIELEYNFEMIAKSLKDLTKEQRASLLWFIIGINDEEIKHLVTVELIIPHLNELIAVKEEKDENR